MKRVKGTILTLLGGICWGLSGSMGQYLFTKEEMDSRWLVPIRLFLAGVILLVFCLVRSKDKLLGIWKDEKGRILLLIYGLAGVSLCQYTYFRTIQLSSAAVGTILQDLSPIMILMCSCLIARRRPLLIELLSLVMAILGIICITTHGDFSTMVISSHALITGLVSAACVTVYNMLTAPLTEKYPVSVLQAWSFLLGGILLAIVFRSWEIHYIPTLTGCMGIIFVIVVGNVLAFTAYISGVHYIGPELGILYGFSEPVTAAIVSVLFLGSSFGIWDFVGFLCIFVMLCIISWTQKRKEN